MSSPFIVIDEISQKLNEINSSISNTLSTINSNVNTINTNVSTVSTNVNTANTNINAIKTATAPSTTANASGTLSQKLSWIGNSLIGATGNTGGSATAGTVMGKLNALMSISKVTVTTGSVSSKTTDWVTYNAPSNAILYVTSVNNTSSNYLIPGENEFTTYIKVKGEDFGYGVNTVTASYIQIVFG